MSAATGVSIRTIRTISKESDRIKKGERNCFLTPNKKRTPKKRKTNLDDFDRCTLRRLIRNYYLVEKKIPTLKRIHRKFSEDDYYTGSIESLRKEILSVGFRWRKTKTNRKLLMEKHDISYLRCNYLQNIKRYREQNRPIIFTDETYIHSSNECLKKPIGKGARLIIVHAGGENGFVPEAYVRWKSNSTGDYHNEMNYENYKKWIQEKLIPNLPPKSVLVIDNAPYHNKQLDKCPTSASNNEDMRRWLRQKNIIHSDTMLKTELYNLIKLNKPHYKSYEIDLLLNEHGHDVLRLPPYHPDLNPIELVWESLKRYVLDRNVFTLKQIETLCDQFFNEFTVDEWILRCKHSKQIEDDFISQEPLMDEVIDEFVINLQEDSDSDSDVYFSDSSDGSLSGIDE